MTTTPSFDFFPADFITGTLTMHPIAVGIYIRMLCHQWQHGSVPATKRQLVQITGAMPDELDEHLPDVMAKFETDENGGLVNARLRRERERKDRVRAKRSAAGRSSAQARSRSRKPSTNAATSVATHVEQVLPSLDESLDSTPKPKRFDPRWVDLPFASPDFIEAWAEFVQMRKETKKPIKTETGAKRLLKTLKEMGEKKATAALHHSTANEYQGVFPPDERKPAEPERPAWKKATPIPGLYGATA